MMDGSRPTLDDIVAEQEADAPAAQPAIVDDPKARAARLKAPQMHIVPSTALAWLAEAMRNGAIEKDYGERNWVAGEQIDITVYIDAAFRHLMAIAEGEDFAEDSGIPHAAHLMANMAIILDARAAKKLRDDRLNGNVIGFAETQREILERRARYEAKQAAKAA